MAFQRQVRAGMYACSECGAPTGSRRVNRCPHCTVRFDSTETAEQLGQLGRAFKAVFLLVTLPFRILWWVVTLPFKLFRLIFRKSEEL